MADRSITVRLRAEVNDFTREMARGAQSLDALVKKSGDAAGAASTTMGRVAQSVRLQGDAWSTVSGGAAAAGAATLGVGAMVAKTGIAYNTLQQTSRAALGTILGGGQKANDQMAKLDAFARTSPFSKQVFIQAQQQMLAFGVESQKVVPYLSAINDAVAASGGNSQMLGEVAFVIAQIGAAGKITATDLMQLGQRGINAAELIGSQMGMTGAEIRSSITAGTLDAGQALDALAAGMSQRFAGASAAVKDTMGGALDRVSAAWRDLAATIMSSAVDPDGGGWLVDLTNTLADLVRVAGKVPEPALQAGTAIAGLAGAGALSVAAITTLVPKYIEWREATAKLAEVSPRASKAITGLSKAAGVATLALAGMVITEAVLTSFDGAAKSSEELARSLDLIAKRKTTLDDLFLGADGKGIGAQIPGIRDGVYDLGSALDALGDKGAGMVSSWTTMWSLVSPVANIGLIGEALGIISTDGDKARETFGRIGQELARMPAADAAAAFAEISTAMTAQGISAQQMIDLMPTYAAQVQDALKAADMGDLAEDATAVAAVMAGSLPEGLVMTAEGITTVARAAEIQRAALEGTIGGLESWTVAAKMGADTSAEAAKAYQSWIDTIAQGDAAFVDTTSAWDAVIAKNREVAEAAAAATKDTKDSWTDFYDGHTVAIGDYLDELQAQVDAQSEWEANLVMLAGRASQGVIDHLTQMGPAGAAQVAALVDASDEEMARFEALFAERGDDATGAFAETLVNARGVWEALAATAGEAAADAALREVAAGTTTLEEVVRSANIEYIIKADTAPAIAAVNATLAEIRSKTATITIRTNVAPGVYHRNGLNAAVAHGGILEYYAAGGFSRAGDVANAHQPTILPAGTNRLFAEPETGGEAYIPLANDWRRPRALSIWAETGRRLGAELAAGYAAGGIAAFANGGVLGSGAGARAAVIDINVVGIFPVQQIAELAAALKVATAETKPFAKAAKAATYAQDKATKTRKDAEADLKAARKQKATTRAQKAARQKAIDAAEKRLEAAKNAQTKATEKAKVATDALTEASKERADLERDLAQAQQEVASAARSAADAFRSNWMNYGDQENPTATAWAASMKEGAVELGAFADQITQLRKLGLNESLVQQIIDWGEDAGAKVAADIIAQGKPGAETLNRAGKRLDKAAEKMGLSAAIGELKLVDAGTSLTKAATKLMDAAAKLGAAPAAAEASPKKKKKLADGGIEDHTAHIATTMRIFAEPETGGEAYIPLAVSKRARSLSIWAETGRRLGVTSYANGGLRPAPARAVTAGTSPEIGALIAEVVQLRAALSSITVVDADRRLIGTMKVQAAEVVGGVVGAMRRR